MHELIRNLTIVTVFAPLLGSLITGLGGKRIGHRGAYWSTILLMLVSLASAAIIFKLVIFNGAGFYGALYTWGVSQKFQFDFGFMIDHLTAVMMLIVTFVSTLVHIYSIGYMSNDPGYERFFSYVSLFTFMMLMLCSANNFFQLFFGWEGVGLASYLLIGFWYQKESAAVGSLKAFLVNRVGDFGFILGLAAIFDYFGTLDYRTVFAGVDKLLHATISIFPGTHWSIITLICILLFIGAMGKSAQMPLHVWLPESMEGPTPISALIHAATMVTAGVFMVARMSPLFEFSHVALSMVLIIGATGALFTGILAFVEFDIKRVIAFSTMSQLGYMMVANGVSAYSAGIFHLLTHACFKALLFLSAGSIIIAMNHEQDLRKMGNLKKYLPVTYVTFLIGALALSAIPPFSGFYSKDSIIDAVHHSTLVGSEYGYICLLIGAFVTSYYIFRAFFMAFHTKERMDEPLRKKLKETHGSMRFAQIGLAIPSVFLGMFMIHPILYAVPSLLGKSVLVLPKYNVLTEMAKSYNGAFYMLYHSLVTVAFWFSVGGVVSAWLMVIVVPKIPVFLKRYLPFLYRILIKQYGFDALNWLVFIRGGTTMANFFFKFGDLKLIDNFMVDGCGRNVNRMARLMRRLQSGYIYHYVFVMILGLLAFLIWLVLA